MLRSGDLVQQRYKLVRRIGSGGMADVWLAEDVDLGRRVALKFLLERFSEDREFLERFRREASSAAGLQHPNVVAVHDRGVHDGRPYIAMEYVEGNSLKEAITAGLTIEQAVGAIKQVLHALEFAHEQGIVHRDIKPQNVLVDRQGRCRVTDFGIAKAGPSEITLTGSVLGTAQYLSPEQAQGAEITFSSDIYSVGAVLYEALTGRVPFDGPTPVAVALKQVNEDPAPPSSINPSVPRALDAIVMRALAKNPAHRFASAAGFNQALDRAIADPETPISESAVHAAVIAGPVVPAYDYEAERRRRRLIIGGVVLLVALLAAGIFLLSRSNELLVPTVKDFSEERAVNVLEAAGFEVEVDRVTRDDVPKGEVFDQDPNAGVEVETQSDLARFFEGSEPPLITITVSTGPGDVEVPAVVGESVETATQRLEQAGLEVERVNRFSAGVREGRVIDAEPPAGTTVRAGSTVTIFVSKGARLIPIPEVVGLEEDDARDELTEAGFLVDVDREESDEDEGIVISQDTGSEPKNTAITIVVSQGPGEVTMPSLAGESRDDAVDELRGAGFTGNIEIVEQDTDDPDSDDVVIQQFPSPGSDLDPSTPVQITVGVFVEPEEPPTDTTTTTTTPTTTPEEH